MDRLHAIDHLALAAAMAEPANQPGASFAALHALSDVLVGASIFTLLAFDFPRNVARRLYSSNETLYPAGAEDPIADSIWVNSLIVRRQPLVLNDRAALATLLPNTEQLAALGCESMLNQPMVIAGQTIGALNMLHQAGRYTPERVVAARALSPAAAAMLLPTAMQGK